MNTRLICDLTKRAVVIKAHQCSDVCSRKIRRAHLRDKSVGVRWIANDDNLDVAASNCVKRLALHREDLCVCFEKILALHTL